MDFSSYTYLEKYLNSFDDSHPLLNFFELNPDYKTDFDKLLGELDSIPNLESKIKIMKDASNWDSIVSELEFARSIKALNPEFIQAKNKPDLKITLNQEDIFFEVKLLSDTDEASRVYKEIWAEPSDFVVKIDYGLLDEGKADAIIEFVKTKIKSQQTGSFSINGTDIEISKKKTIGSERTWVVSTMKSIKISFEWLRKKVLKDFWDKLHQFSSEQFVFWVIDVKNWKYATDDLDFKDIVYGKTVEDPIIGYRNFVGFEDIYKAYMTRPPELFNDTGLVPTFRYPLKDGLFFLNEAKCLDGLVVRSFSKQYFLVNPFSEPQLQLNTIRTLKERLTKV
jgi:hypothetical protein